MQNPASLERPLGIRVKSLSTIKPLSRRQRKLPDLPSKRSTSSAVITFTKTSPSHAFSQKESQAHSVPVEREYIKAKNYLSMIKDPLWKHICSDVITMMGPASVLKIWNSRLGDVSPQAKDIEIYSQTEEISQFIQQYAFVILGSLKSYFPALKQVRVKTVSTL
jgi:hypothetical protein